MRIGSALRRADRLASRRRHGLCVNCGYDRASKEGCPECGTPILKTDEKAAQ
jgi:predicted amidophosphoribosyltransferase